MLSHFLLKLPSIHFIPYLLRSIILTCYMSFPTTRNAFNLLIIIFLPILLNSLKVLRPIIPTIRGSTTTVVTGIVNKNRPTICFVMPKFLASCTSSEFLKWTIFVVMPWVIAVKAHTLCTSISRMITQTTSTKVLNILNAHSLEMPRLFTTSALNLLFFFWSKIPILQIHSK